MALTSEINALPPPLHTPQGVSCPDACGLEMHHQAWIRANKPHSLSSKMNDPYLQLKMKPSLMFSQQTVRMGMILYPQVSTIHCDSLSGDGCRTDSMETDVFSCVKKQSALLWV